MGIFGHTWDKYREDLKEEGVIITLESEEALDEASLYLKGKKEDIELLIRDKHSATSGAPISKDDKVSEMNHDASIKLRTPKSITGNAGLPVEIHSGRVKIMDSDKNISKNIKKAVEKFAKDNIKELNNIWDSGNVNTDVDDWKIIINRSYKDIKKISIDNKEIIEYLEKKKKGDI